MDKTDMLKTGVIKLPVTKQPWACINMNCGRLRRWIGHEWMDGVKKKIKNCELPHLSSTENRVYVKTKRSIFMEKPFSAHNISMLIQDIILKNGWCYSIPGPLKMLKRPIFSYSEIGYISAVSSWIIFLSQSFTHCLQMRLPLCLNSSLLWGLMFVLFQAWSFLLTKAKDEVKLEGRREWMWVSESLKQEERLGTNFVTWNTTFARRHVG